MPPTDLPIEIRARYTRLRELEDGRFLGVKRFMAHWRVHVLTDEGDLDEMWCFNSLGAALTALETWNGVGEPDGWDRHPKTGRVRDPATGQVWQQDDPPVVF